MADSHEQYHIDYLVDQSSNYVTYFAREVETGAKCLLRRYRKDKTTGLGRIDGWEEKLSALITHFVGLDIPSLSNIINGGIDPVDGNPFVVFEWFERQHLNDVIDGKKYIDTLAVDHLIKNVLKGLEHIHQLGYAHGALTPNAILYTGEPTKDTWVIDWDPVIALKASHGMQRVVTNEYCSPELAAQKIVTTSDDLYALGKILERADDHGPILSHWIGRLTARKNKRFKSIPEARSGLQGDKGKYASPPKPTLSRRRKPIKKPILITLASLSGLCLASLIIMGAVWISQDKSSSPSADTTLSTSLKPNDLAMAEKNLQQEVTITGKIKFIDQSQSKKTTYFYFSDERQNPSKTIWLEVSTALVSEDLSLSRINQKFLGKKVSTKEVLRVRDTKIGSRNGYYLKLRSMDGLRLL